MRVHGAESQEMAVLRATAKENVEKRAAIRTQYPQIRDADCANEGEDDIDDVLRRNLMLHDRKIEKAMQQYYFLLGQRSSIAFENKSKFLVSALFEAVKSFPHLLQQMAVAVQVYQRGLTVRTTLLVPEYTSFDLQDDTHVSEVLAQLGDRRQGQCIPFYILWNIVVTEISRDPSQQATELTKHAVNMKPKGGQSVSAFIYEMDYIFNVLLNLGVPAQPSLKFSIASEGLVHFSEPRFNTFLETLEDTSTMEEKGQYEVLRKKSLAFCERNGDPVMAGGKVKGGGALLVGASASASQASSASDFSIIPEERVHVLLQQEKARLLKLEVHAGKSKCTTCGKAGHLASVCRNHLQCTKCGKRGHELVNCRVGVKPLVSITGAKRGAGSETRTCYKCGVAGHVMRECKAARSSERLHMFAAQSSSSASGVPVSEILEDVDGSQWLSEVIDHSANVLVQEDQLGALLGQLPSSALHQFYRTQDGLVVDLQTILDCGATNHATPQRLFFTKFLRLEPLGGVLTATGALSAPDGKGQALGHSRAIFMKNLTMTLISSSVLHELMGFGLRASRRLIYEMEDPDTHDLKLTFVLVRGIYRICPALSPWYHSPVSVPASLPTLSVEATAKEARLHAFIDECYTMQMFSVARSQAVAYLDAQLSASHGSINALDEVDAEVEAPAVADPVGKFFF